MSFNQSQIKGLTVDTIADAASKGGLGQITYVRELQAFFEYKVDSSLDHNGTNILTAQGTDAFWVRPSQAQTTSSILVAKTGHGLTVGNPVTSTGTKARSNDAATLSIGVVSNVIDADSFEYITNGLVKLDAGDWTAISDESEELVVGEFYYTSPTNAGNVTKETPASPNFDNPVGYATSATEMIVMPYRPSVSSSDVGTPTVEPNEVLLDEGLNADLTLTLPADLSEYTHLRFEVDDVIGDSFTHAFSAIVPAADINGKRVYLYRNQTASLHYDVSSNVATLTKVLFGASTKHRVIGIKAGVTVIPANAIKVNATNLIDGDTLIYNATSKSLVKQTFNVANGTDTAATLNQLTGATWTVSNSDTNPASSGIILNTENSYYVQEGRKRHYTLFFYIDIDTQFTFEVTGASDVFGVMGETAVVNDSGSAQASPSVSLRRASANNISIDRDNHTDEDTRIMLTFTAIMA